MVFLIGLLTVGLVLDCLLLILLVLIQLPKKEAGAGVAFGGAATDALFGAGTGNVLTKTTKYATVLFFVLLLLIGISQKGLFSKDSKEFQRQVEEASKNAPQPTAPLTTPAITPAPAGTNLLTTTPESLTNAAPAATNAPK
jgi:preprotein translocase subunit SecG